jgi:hypothetical protein
MEWIILAQGRVLMWSHVYIIMEPWVPLDARNLLSVACTGRKQLHYLLVIRESVHKLVKKSKPVWASKHTISS